MRVIVTGSRDWGDRDAVYRALMEEVVVPHWEKGHDSEGNFVDYVPPDDFVLVHGACPTGAEAIADDWAAVMMVKVERFPPYWAQYGKRAGFHRYVEMVAAGADLCLAFIGRQNRQASMAANLAEQSSIPVRRWEMSA